MVFEGFYRNMAYDLDSDVDAVAMPMLDDAVQTVRTVFPETWIWDLAEVG